METLSYHPLKQRKQWHYHNSESQIIFTGGDIENSCSSLKLIIKMDKSEVDDKIHYYFIYFGTNKIIINLLFISHFKINNNRIGFALLSYHWIYFFCVFFLYFLLQTSNNCPQNWIIISSHCFSVSVQSVGTSIVCEF